MGRVADARAAIGPQIEKTTLGGELGIGGFAVPAPVTKMWSVTGVPGETEPTTARYACALQFWKLPRTKSLRVAVVEVDERLSAMNEGKHSSPMPSASG